MTVTFNRQRLALDCEYELSTVLPATFGAHARTVLVTRRHLVLAGAGHGQLDLLAALTEHLPEGWDVSLVTPQPDFHYSGMLPAVLAGMVTPAAAQVPVAAIARTAGLHVIVSAVSALDPQRRELILESGERLRYDLLSLDVGSVPAAMAVPGVYAHAYAMRPFASALRLMAKLDQAILDAPHAGTVPAVVVGGGAAGVEIAFAMSARIRRGGRTPAVTIVDATSHDGLPLSGFAKASRRLAARALTDRSVALLAGTVKEVKADSVIVQTADGLRTVESFATAWVTGAAAAPWLVASGLACDERGYPLADAHLALTADRSIFGAGDCITLREAPATPKAGVFAVRMAPVLAENVLAAARGSSATRRYTPQSGFLALLSTSDGSALLHWKGVTLVSRWAHALKSWIDERYLRRYRALPV